MTGPYRMPRANRPARPSIRDGKGHRSRLCSGAALMTAFLAAAPATAVRAQPKLPVRIDAHGIFGDELLLPNGYTTLRIELTNTTARSLRGTLSVQVAQWRAPPVRHELALDLPGLGERRALITVFVENGSDIRIRYDVGGREAGRAQLSNGYASVDAGVVVMADPPRIRGALLDLAVENTGAPSFGAPGTVETYPTGVVPIDRASGDPILPTDAVGWSKVRLLVASAPLLMRAGPREQQALGDWVRTGGEILVFPRSDADLRDPLLVSWLGMVEPFEAPANEDQPAFVPASMSGRYLRGESGFRTEAFGGSKRFGFGRVYVATYDGTVPPAVDGPEPIAIVRAIVSQVPVKGVEQPLLDFGKGQDSFSDAFGANSFGSLRATLDPNEGYRPALGLVAIMLLFYVVLIGPINFAFIGKRNRPTLALITTPAAALGCLVLMLGLGYLGKGVRTRYRAVSVVESMEGDSSGVMRRYSGLFLTRPATFAVPGPERGFLMPLRSDSSDLSPTYSHAESPPVLGDLRGRLWETIFTREDLLEELGGSVIFDRQQGVLVRVHNRTKHRLRGAVMVDRFGWVYRIGDIDAGGSAEVNRDGTLHLEDQQMFWGREDTNLRQFGRVMNLPRERNEALHGAIRLLGGTLMSPGSPALFAWVDAPPRPAVAGIFGREEDYWFVRIVADPERDPVSSRFGYSPQVDLIPPGLLDAPVQSPGLLPADTDQNPEGAP